MAMARRMWRSCCLRGSWLSSSRWRIASKASPGRAMTDNSIVWVTRKREVSGSGSEAISFSKVCSDQATNPSGAFLRTTLRRFFGSSPALASAFSFSTTCSGACATTSPAVSKPARPARPAIWWNSRLRSTRTRVPSYLVSAVNSTVRIGTLTPTPSVSVPQITFSSPAWASRSTSRRYFGSIPAWCTPMPCRTYRERFRPNLVVKRKLPISSAMRSFSSRVHMLMLISACARSTAWACVKCTM